METDMPDPPPEDGVSEDPKKDQDKVFEELVVIIATNLCIGI